MHAFCDAEGQWVRYADHAAEVAAAENNWEYIQTMDNWAIQCGILPDPLTYEGGGEACAKNIIAGIETALAAANARAEVAEAARLAAVRDRDTLRDECRRMAAKWEVEPPGNYDFDQGHADGCRECAAQLAEVVGRGEGENG